MDDTRVIPVYTQVDGEEVLMGEFSVAELREFLIACCEEMEE